MKNIYWRFYAHFESYFLDQGLVLLPPRVAEFKGCKNEYFEIKSLIFYAQQI